GLLGSLRDSRSAPRIERVRSIEPACAARWLGRSFGVGSRRRVDGPVAYSAAVCVHSHGISACWFGSTDDPLHKARGTVYPWSGGPGPRMVAWASHLRIECGIYTGALPPQLPASHHS